MTPPPSRVTALVDRSAYGDSVAEHGAWLAERIDARLQLRHVRETDEDAQVGRELLEGHARRLVDLGLPAPDLSLVEGGVLAAALDPEADLIVMGKRGADSAGNRAALGGHVDAVVRATTKPVCLSAQVFLPIHRVVAITDAALDRRAALDLVARYSSLEALDLDVVIAARADEDPEAKLALARNIVAGRGGTFPIQAERLGEAIWGYLENRPTDLIVISRDVLLGSRRGPLRTVSPDSFWSARASVLVC